MSARSVVGPEMLRAIVRTERHRAERSELPFALVLVRIACAQAPHVTHAVIDAVTATTRAGDMIGWAEEGELLAIVVPGIQGASAADEGTGLVARIRRELTRSPAHEALADVSIGLHLYRLGSVAANANDPLARLLDAAGFGLRVWRAIDDGLKRTLDISASAVLLTGLGPLLALVALLVKATSPGPVLFRHVRVGRSMQPFTMLKFRTMYSGADHGIHQAFIRQFIDGSGGDGGLFKLTNDPRVTPLGRLLRRSSIDELPQLWNVLRGEMSLVGPRPPLPYEVERYRPWHRRRLLEAKPGITGVWQVSGRSRTTFDQMVRLDLRYARTRTLWRDVRLLLATPAAALSGRGAV